MARKKQGKLEKARVSLIKILIKKVKIKDKWDQHFKELIELRQCQIDSASHIWILNCMKIEEKNIISLILKEKGLRKILKQKLKRIINY